MKEEIRLNIRSGPGVQFRIMGRMKTGDAVQVLERGDGWTKVRVPSLGEGWIPEGRGARPDFPVDARHRSDRKREDANHHGAPTNTSPGPAGADGWASNTALDPQEPAP